MTDRKWHYEKDGKSEGPVTDDTLRALIESGEVGPHTLVWAHPMDDWAIAAEIEQLKPLFPTSPPPLPQFRQPPPLPGSGGGRNADSGQGANPFASAVKPGAGGPGASPADSPAARQGAEPYRTGEPAPRGVRSEPTAAVQMQSASSEGGAWSRFAARTFDYFLVVSYWTLMLMAFAPAYLTNSNGLIIVLFAMFSWVFIESLLLSIFGTTPGKYLLGIRLEKFGEKRPSFPDALARSFGVWLQGEAAGLPFVNLLTWYMGLNRLTKKGMTAWDEKYGFTVTCAKSGAFGIIIFVLLLALMAIFLILEGLA
ncbi:MAG: hypothetical protein CL946_04640 [Ectothiorhodospiraceae bacterium]|nr:hypothetical protein [Ectothiorhodospiraceae bacterium]